MKDIKINIIFPMAGDALRFGHKFKPFLKLGDMTFIEHAVEPFYKWRHLIDKIYFIYRKDQEEENNVSDYLSKNIDSSFNIVPIVLESKTNGPRETISKALSIIDIKNGIICDCDHKIDVDKLFQKILETKFKKTVIPVWSITEEESGNWSKIVSDGSEIVDIVEKEKVDFKRYNIWGILGCIFFPDLSYFVKTEGVYVSDVCRKIFNSKQDIVFATVDDAYFFGDPEMFEKCVNRRRNECSIFCDIDGVLLKHSDHSNNNVEKNLPLINNIKALNNLRKENHKVILTTARSPKYRAGLERLLKDFNIQYDYLICGLASGPRILINDRKPSKPFTLQANAIESYRNELLMVNTDQILKKNAEAVLQDLSANSGAKTFLMSDSTHTFIRKLVKKNNIDSDKHIQILKRQFTDLERFNFFKNGLSPKVIDSYENSLEFYIDMQFLEGYKKLSTFVCTTQRNVLKKVMLTMKNNVYCYKKYMLRPEAIKRYSHFLEEKIIKKLDSFSNQNELMKKLINEDYVLINGEKYSTLREIFNNKGINNFCPLWISPVHGDLTLENILYDMIKDEYSLIDMDGARIMDTHFLDLGKLSQSILAHYDEWNNIDIDVTYENGEFHCDPKWLELHEEDANMLRDIWPFEGDCIEEAIFYMSTYFIRFVPFRMIKGFNHGLFALIMAVVWLNKLNLGDSK